MSEKKLQKAKRRAEKREQEGSKPHTCHGCGKQLGMSQAFLALGYFWCESHRPY